MSSYAVIIDNKFIQAETQDDLLKILRSIVDDEEITIVDIANKTVYTHYGHYFLDKIFEWLKSCALSNVNSHYLLDKIFEWLKSCALLTVPRFDNMLEVILHEWI